MYTSTKLASGAELISIPLTGSQTTTVLAMIATGSKYETREQSGLSHFLEHMFFKGTTKRPTAHALSSELDKIGAEFNAFTSKEYTGYYVKVASQHMDTAIDVVSDMLANPLLDAEEIKRESGVIIEEVNMYLDNPMWYIEDLFEELLYGDTPAGWSTIGTKDNIKAFTREDFVNYYQSQYVPTNSIIIVAGALPSDPEAWVAKYFNATSDQTAKAKLVTTESQSSPASRLHYKKTDQSHLSLGVRTFAYGHADAPILKLISLALGGSMSSRLFINLRERNGLAYYVRTNSEAYTDTGYLSTQAGVPVDKLEDAVKIIINEYSRLTTELISDEELSKLKGLIHGKIPLSLEGSDDNAQWYASQAVTLKQQASAKSPKTPEEFLAAIDQVTAADIQRVAAEIFRTDKLNLAVIGPYDNIDNLQSLLTINN